jgi:hypothetical protein
MGVKEARTLLVKEESGKKTLFYVIPRQTPPVKPSAHKAPRHSRKGATRGYKGSKGTTVIFFSFVSRPSNFFFSTSFHARGYPLQREGGDTESKKNKRIGVIVVGGGGKDSCMCLYERRRNI